VFGINCLDACSNLLGRHIVEIVIDWLLHNQINTLNGVSDPKRRKSEWLSIGGARALTVVCATWRRSAALMKLRVKTISRNVLASSISTSHLTQKMYSNVNLIRLPAVGCSERVMLILRLRKEKGSKLQELEFHS